MTGFGAPAIVKTLMCVLPQSWSLPIQKNKSLFYYPFWNFAFCKRSQDSDKRIKPNKQHSVCNMLQTNKKNMLTCESHKHKYIGIWFAYNTNIPFIFFAVPLLDLFHSENHLTCTLTHTCSRLGISTCICWWGFCKSIGHLSQEIEYVLSHMILYEWNNESIEKKKNMFVNCIWCDKINRLIIVMIILMGPIPPPWWFLIQPKKKLPFI